MSKNSGYGQFCPVAMAAQVLATRWTPLILRELTTKDTMRFSELRKGVPRISQSLLTKRLDELEFHGLVSKAPLDSGGNEYALTEAGKATKPIIELMGLWGHNYLMHELTEDDYDPDLLFWDVRRSMDVKAPASKRPFVLYFELQGTKKSERYWWIVFDKTETDLCCRDPGREVDLKIFASLESLTNIWIGLTDSKTELREKRMKIEGSKQARDNFLNWFALSPFAKEETRHQMAQGIAAELR